MHIFVCYFSFAFAGQGEDSVCVEPPRSPARETDTRASHHAYPRRTIRIDVGVAVAVLSSSSAGNAVNLAALRTLFHATIEYTHATCPRTHETISCRKND